MTEPQAGGVQRGRRGADVQARRGHAQITPSRRSASTSVLL
jgi:hypothetical protein